MEKKSKNKAIMPVIFLVIFGLIGYTVFLRGPMSEKSKINNQIAEVQKAAENIARQPKVAANPETLDFTNRSFVTSTEPIDAALKSLAGDLPITVNPTGDIKVAGLDNSNHYSVSVTVEGNSAQITEFLGKIKATAALNGSQMQGKTPALFVDQLNMTMVESSLKATFNVSALSDAPPASLAPATAPGTAPTAPTGTTPAVPGIPTP